MFGLIAILFHNKNINIEIDINGESISFISHSLLEEIESISGRKFERIVTDDNLCAILGDGIC